MDQNALWLSAKNQIWFKLEKYYRSVYKIVINLIEVVQIKEITQTTLKVFPLYFFPPVSSEATLDTELT